ncbi:hypothetical protein EJP82_20890 [Paenibacillus anaericanus]|uniref:NERD domain-containing protein n=1 Tax=Paenibacillus anaericanus TaxID=170367 RepID=A0A433Y4E9_9BACL|nr:hypothetical protein [Paenibacillus anaericanus]RUT43273.1 hypothetical protein EJP82_20890 [Paenibacillus anaericanus]
MECPKCNSNIDLSYEDFKDYDPKCVHCGFYYYLRHVLRLACSAWMKIDKHENYYFRNVHENLYEPFIQMNNKKVNPIQGAISVGEYLINAFKSLVNVYPKEDLVFMTLALRELATWKIILERNDAWASVQVRNVAHTFTNILESVEEDKFGDIAILEETDFITAFVMIEEIEKIISNVFNCSHFSWNPNLEEIIKTRVENDHLAFYHKYFEVEELLKPEEIEFENAKINNFLEQRNMTIFYIKNSVSIELEHLFGFSFKDLVSLREDIISISKDKEQIFEILPLAEDISIKIAFVFKNQIMDAWSNKIENILKFMTYNPTYNSGDSFYKLNNPHMDYKFIYNFEDLLAIGFLDSSNSITIFENVSTSDHFIEDIFGKSSTKVFKKAQRDISYLMGMKIADYFSERKGFYVPMQQKGVPNINIKTIVGNGIKKRIVNRENQDLGDIDAVVVDIVHKEILLFEIKYYKPATNNLDMLKKDKKIFEDINKILERAKWVEENISDIIEAWNLDTSSYTLKTLLITGRPNYYGEQVQREMNNIEYYTFDSIFRKYS